VNTARQGDRVQVHYVKRFRDGSTASSRSHGGGPLEVTIGTDHPRLRGLGSGLVGLVPGSHVTVAVPAGVAHGPFNPARVRRLSRARFPEGQALPVGKWMRIVDRRGRRRLVRIVEVGDRVVVVDTNHPHAGEALELEVELVGIQAEGAGSELKES
jgi:FKBP-type peptidyl-prolyl cis-trans isomerase 2